MTMNILHGPHWEIAVADVSAALRELPASSVHTAITSVPYWGLRDYGTAKWEGGDPGCDHLAPPKRLQAGFNERYHGKKFATDKQGELAGVPFRERCTRCGAKRIDEQIGLEPHPDLWVKRLVAVFEEVKRVLRDDGTLWLNVGDSYAQGGRGPAGVITLEGGRHNLQEGRAAIKALGEGGRRAPSGIKEKDLIGQPWMLAFALRAAGWYLRADICWSKLNPMPESIKDRPTKSHEYIFLLAKNSRYFYDNDAIREGYSVASIERSKYTRTNTTERLGALLPGAADNRTGKTYINGNNPQGRNVRSVWSISTARFDEGHFATFPPELPERCIKAGTSEKGVCPICGAPWVRIVARGPIDPAWQAACGGDANGGYEGRSAKHEQREKVRCKGRMISEDGEYLDLCGWSGVRSDLIRPVVDTRDMECPRCGNSDWIEAESPPYRRAQTANRQVKELQNSSDVKARILAGLRERRTVGWKPTCGCSPLWKSIESMMGIWDPMRACADPTCRHALRSHGRDHTQCGHCRCHVFRWGDPYDPVPATVLDPFSGAATTGLVALRLGRRYLGVELSPKYAEISRKRLQADIDARAAAAAGKEFGITEPTATEQKAMAAQLKLFGGE
jgi:DNA modification methylase